MKYNSVNSNETVKVKKSIFILVCSLLVILFLNTGFSKFLDFNNSVIDMNGQPFPNGWSKGLVLALAISEIGIAASFFVTRTRLLGLYGALILMSLFSLYATLVLAHVFAKVPCSCGGFMRGLSWPQHLVVTTAAGIASAWCIRASKYVKEPMRKLSKASV